MLVNFKVLAKSVILDWTGITMIFCSIWFSFLSCLRGVTSMSCGVDNSPNSHICEGVTRIEDYPWLGVLYYPHNGHKFTTAVVLVTRQIVLAAATEIDKLAKEDFRDKARVIIGYNCSGPRIGIRDYTYHPDYSKDTYSTLAIIQLEIDHVSIKLRPICPPPTYLKDQNFYAMVLSDNCKQSKVRIHKMTYVSPDQCKSFYRRSGLGFGVYGPGCEAPARFLDYGMYHEWVQRSIARIGRPAITNLDDNHVVLRRSYSKVQRFGPCDGDETRRQLYKEETKIGIKKRPHLVMRHNLTIIADVEYSCVIIRADYDKRKGCNKKPKMRIRRWCSGGGNVCYGFGHMEMHFYIEIAFIKTVSLQITAYGREAAFIDPLLASKYLNRQKEHPLIINYNATKELVKPWLSNSTYIWFGKGQF